MSTRTSNRERSLWTVDLLGLAPTDRVLEIGYGPGIALQAVMQRVPEGAVVGVDHSATMMRVATRRNRAAVRAGRMLLHEGTADALNDVLDPAANRFEHIFAVNVVLFWSDPAQTLRLLKPFLAPNGQIALTLQPRGKKATNQDAIKAGETLSLQMRQAGLGAIQIEYFKDVAPYAVCVRGRLATGARVS